MGDLRDIAEMDPAAATLVGDLMLHSAREREGIFESLLVSAERERDEWKSRALAAERRLRLARERIFGLFEDAPAFAEDR